MSGTSTSNTNGTIIISGPDVLQISDFYVKAGVLHPIAIGSIAVVGATDSPKLQALFAYLRLGSNRSIAPITMFDWLINVALGSTLAGIVNGNSLVRGLLGLATMLGFQYFTSWITSRFNQKLSWIFEAQPLVVVFRGQMLTQVMKKHRISIKNIHASLRQYGILNVCQVECAIIEPNGAISVFTTETLEDAKVDPEVLMTIPAYKALCEHDIESGHGDRVIRRNTGMQEEETNGSSRRDRKSTEASRDLNDLTNAVS